MNLKNIKLCNNNKLDAILKTIILFVLLLLIVLCVLLVGSDWTGFDKVIVHSLKIVIKILSIVIIIDYIRIKSKKMKQ